MAFDRLIWMTAGGERLRYVYGWQPGKDLSSREARTSVRGSLTVAVQRHQPYTESMKAAWALALLSTSLAGQTTGKDKPAGYPAHAAGRGVSIGAEYLVHSIPAGSQTLFARDYLVVEVAVFPAKKTEPVEIGTRTFSLRLNGRKQMLTPDAPGFVAASLKYPDWEQHPTAEAQVGIGNADVIIGRPPAVGRFPGDPNEGRLPPDQRRGVAQQEQETPEQIIARTALPEGLTAKPASGYLYFHFRGKLKSIKSLELVYQGKAETVTLKLM
jgi:hypothetical protein